MLIKEIGKQIVILNKPFIRGNDDDLYDNLESHNAVSIHKEDYQKRRDMKADAVVEKSQKKTENIGGCMKKKTSN